MGLSVQFTNLSTGDIAYQVWDFGDGVGVSLELNPLYTYPAGGTYNVTLYDIGVWGGFAQKTHPVTVVNEWCIDVDFVTGHPVAWQPLPGSSYQIGVGFVGNFAAGNQHFVGCYCNFSLITTLTKIEFTYATDHNLGVSAVEYGGYNPNVNPANLAQDLVNSVIENPLTVPIGSYTFSHPVNDVIGGLALQFGEGGVGIPMQWKITSAHLEGTGTPPSGIGLICP